MNSGFVHISRTVGKMLGTDRRFGFLLQYGETAGFLPLSGSETTPLAGADRGQEVLSQRRKILKWPRIAQIRRISAEPGTFSYFIRNVWRWLQSVANSSLP
jgi:hypothetical protein